MMIMVVVVVTTTRVRSLICRLDVFDQQTCRVQLETFSEFWCYDSITGYMTSAVMMAEVSVGIMPVSPVRNVCIGYKTWQQNRIAWCCSSCDNT